MIIFSERAQAYRAGVSLQDSVTPLTTEVLSRATGNQAIYQWSGI